MPDYILTAIEVAKSLQYVLCTLTTRESGRHMYFHFFQLHSDIRRVSTTTQNRHIENNLL